MTIEPEVRDFGVAGIPFSTQAINIDGVQADMGLLAAETLREWHHSMIASSNTLIVVKSLPYKAYNFDPFFIAERVGFRGERVLEMGSNCTAILDAFELAGHYAAFGKTTSVICADRFGDVAGNSVGLRKAGLQDWRNAVALVQVVPNRSQTSIMRVASKAAPELFDMLSVVQAGGVDYLQSSTEKISKFRRIDLRNELTVIKSALGSIAPSSCLFVLTNRNSSRTKILSNALCLEDNQIFSSRNVIGHTGGSDIIYNLNCALRVMNNYRKHILISANGLGYQWSAALLQTRNDCFQQ